MNNLRRLSIVHKCIDFHRNIPLLLLGNPAKVYYSTQTQQSKQETQQTQQTSNEAHYLDILLDNIPSPWSETQIAEKSDTTAAFKQWTSVRNLSEEDGQMLNRLKEHIKNGGHPNFPRLTRKDNNNKKSETCLKHWTDDYYTSIDAQCFKWIKKQRELYKNKTIHPYIHWKLLQLNLTLQWTREPLQDRDFKWIGYHNDVLNNADTAGLVAESDPLFPLHSKDEPLLKFLNPFYELWYETMPDTLKQLRLMNAPKEPQNGGYMNKDDIRATRIIKRYDTETNEWKYYIGPKNIDQERLDQEILYKNKENITENNENNENMNESGAILRTAYLSKDLYDKNVYSLDELNEFLKSAPDKPSDEIPIEAMNYLREKESKKELKDSFLSARPKPMYSKRQRAEYYIEALKRDLIEASHLNLKELTLIIRHLSLEYHPKQNPNAKQMTQWVPYSSPMRRKAYKTKWNDWNGNKAVPIYEFRPQRYNDINGIFSELDIYYKTRHPGQPPYGVWDIPEPNFDTQYFEIKVESYLKNWRQTAQGKEFIQSKLQRKFDNACKENMEIYNRLNKGVELLMEEKEQKYEQINHNKQFQYKFGDDITWNEKCKQKTVEIQKLQQECQQMDDIIHRVYLYNDI